MDTPVMPTFVDLAAATGWANPPQVADLAADIDAARPSQQEFKTKLQEWESYLNTTGIGAAPVRKGRSQVQPKLIKKQAEWRHPSMSEPFLSSSKLFEVSPRTWEDTQPAKEAELLLNYQFDAHVDKVAFIDEMVRTGDTQGTVVAEVGWKRVVVKVPTEVPTLAFFQATDQAQVDQIQADIQLMGNPLEFNKLPVERQEAAKMSQANGVPVVAIVQSIELMMTDKVVKNHPTVAIIDNQNLFVDPSCNGVVKDARFIGYSFETSKGELRADGRYQNIDHITVSPQSPASDAQHESTTPATFQFRDEERKRLVAYKMYSLYDIENNGVLQPIVSTWSGNILLQLEKSPFSDGEFPFVVIPVNPLRKKWYGEPDGALLIEQQKTVGALTRGMIDLLGRSANAQQGMPKQFLDVANRRKFDNGEDYEYTPAMGNPEQLIIQHKYPEIPQSALILLQNQLQDAESLTGVNTFGNGVNSGSLGDVAAGIKGALAASAKREMSILRRYAAGISAIGQKFMSMSKDFMSDEEIIRITNTQFITITREGIDGQFDITVDVASAEEDNLKAQELAFMLQTLGNKVDWKVVQKILCEIARLRKMPDLAHELEMYQPQPDPLAVAESEARVALTQAQVRSEDAKARAEDARAQFYLAQAANLGAKTDKQNLDTVEQGTGTSHVRKMAEIESQAEANQDLEITKSLAAAGNIEGALGYRQLTKGV